MHQLQINFGLMPTSRNDQRRETGTVLRFPFMNRTGILYWNLPIERHNLISRQDAGVISRRSWNHSDNDQPRLGSANKKTRMRGIQIRLFPQKYDVTVFIRVAIQLR